LAALYKLCLFFVYPSLYEGFGYPVAEAFKLRVPVSTSNTSSLAEIGSNAALLFNPEDTSDIKEKIKLMLESEQMRNKYAQKGLQKVISIYGRHILIQ
jgi:glycosyltransferase involved in cell wall biosynthesis